MHKEMTHKDGIQIAYLYPRMLVLPFCIQLLELTLSVQAEYRLIKVRPLE